MRRSAAVTHIYQKTFRRIIKLNIVLSNKKGEI